MTAPGQAPRAPGLVLGSSIATIFGLVFVEVNSGQLPGGWPLGIRVAGAVVALALLLAILRTSRLPVAEPSPGQSGFADRRYQAIVGAEVVALMGGLFVINGVLERPVFAVPWIAVVVGTHFFGLAWTWRVRVHNALGAAMVVLGVAGFALAFAGASIGTVGLIAGVGSGLALFATAGSSLFAALRST